VNFADLPTPAVLVDKPRLLINIEKMQRAATAAGILLRPHAKTHKSVTIARYQIDAGAVGITVATVGEAEVFADHGIPNIRIAYPLPISTADRIIALISKAQLSIVVDNAIVAKQWSDLMVKAKCLLDVLVKIDVGFHRCGISPRRPAATRFISEVDSLPGLRLRGLLSHAGQAYDASTCQDVKNTARQEAQILRALALDAQKAGIPIQEISVGATPTARFSLEENEITELRPGNYVFLDLTQVALQSATTSNCSLTVLSTIVSRPSPDRLVLDAGSKTLSSDHARGPNAHRGFGAVLQTDSGKDINPNLVIERLSEEHAVVSVTGCEHSLTAGQRVRLIPNHACVVTNLVDYIHFVDEDSLIETIRVDARGKNY
tara:strand:- start:8430 stop:9554 length:1125 start_codon:yes stop_codon:yes gene_type:complete